VRSLGRDDVRVLSGTEGASNQFWSPDSRKLGFFAGGKLRTVDIAGGVPEVIAEAPNGRGGAWNEDGTIIFAPAGGGALSRVRDTSGSQATPLTTLDLNRGENAHYWPTFLPDGKRYLYLVRSTQTENSGIYLGHLDGSPARRVMASLSSAIVARRTSADEWFLLWARDTDLLAQRFDLASAALSGEVSTIASGVRVEDSQLQAHVSASRHGHLAWATSRAAEHALALRTREGRLIRLLDVTAGRNLQPALSPNDTQVLFARVERGLSDIYRHDLKSGVTDRITMDPDYDEGPTWSPSGRALTYRGRLDGKRSIFRLELSSGARPVLVASDALTPGVETPDGRYVIVQVSDGGAARTRAYAFPDFKNSVPVANVPSGMAIAFIWSDGWALVSSTTATQNSVALARLDVKDGGLSLGPLQVAAEGVTSATSRRNGAELFVTVPDGHLRAIAITKAGNNVSFGAPVTLFRLPPGSDTLTVNSDGTQFVIAETPNTVGQTIRVLTNWDSRIR
jgi:Tol biopolymer transport system component